MEDYFKDVSKEEFAKVLCEFLKSTARWHEQIVDIVCKGEKGREKFYVIYESGSQKVFYVDGTSSWGILKQICRLIEDNDSCPYLLPSQMIEYEV